MCVMNGDYIADYAYSSTIPSSLYLLHSDFPLVATNDEQTLAWCADPCSGQVGSISKESASFMLTMGYLTVYCTVFDIDFWSW